MPEAAPAGNGFEIVCALAGHKAVMGGISVTTDDQIWKGFVEVGGRKDITCERCGRALMAMLAEDGNGRMCIKLKEKN